MILVFFRFCDFAAALVVQEKVAEVNLLLFEDAH
jgi:hypothetical protein